MAGVTPNATAMTAAVVPATTRRSRLLRNRMAGGNRCAVPTAVLQRRAYDRRVYRGARYGWIRTAARRSPSTRVRPTDRLFRPERIRPQRLRQRPGVDF